MAIFFTDYYKKHYHSSWYSRTALITYLFMIMAFILPLILVIRTHSNIFVEAIHKIDFWVRKMTYYE